MCVLFLSFLIISKLLPKFTLLIRFGYYLLCSEIQFNMWRNVELKVE